MKEPERKHYHSITGSCLPHPWAWLPGRGKQAIPRQGGEPNTTALGWMYESQNSPGESRPQASAMATRTRANSCPDAESSHWENTAVKIKELTRVTNIRILAYTLTKISK